MAASQDSERGGLVSRNDTRDQPQVLGFLGIALDSTDGHKRVTQSESFLLLGGSEATHEQMQDTAIRLEESLRQRGKRLQEATPDEAIDLLRKAMES